MFGLQEILIITAVILGILFMPRLIARRQPAPTARAKISLSGKIRLAIAASALYPAFAATYLQPWHRDPVLFIYIGLGPVILGWLFYWIVAGFKKK